MRSLLSRISGGLRPSSKRSGRSAHPGEGARLSKLRLGKAVTSHTQSMGFATTCFPFTPWALFRCDRLKRTRTRIGRSNHSCNASLKSEWDWPGRSYSVQSSHIPNWSHAGQMLIQKRNPRTMPSLQEVWFAEPQDQFKGPLEARQAARAWFWLWASRGNLRSG